ncbi:carboxyl-terminal processing protease [Granulicella rosea]|uniref:Carboxyl-terminal processing protease n=1 Tax=Granulicella rosea TaxID=474952 RepID=A0A239KKV6_9BACT|nr:S41 family peptidase [Granulicella rosea]SNT18328.1 carboxyl-terminal processing protease [Granulicella rosea]
MPKSSKVLLLAVSVVLVLTVFVGVHSTGVSAASEPQDGAYRQINVYSEVLRHIQSDYVSEPDIPAVTNGALRGLLESLDADSSYLTPADYTAYKSGKAGKAQVGIVVSKRYGYATVVSVVPNSPAEKAGLVDGDILEAISNQDTRELSLAMIQMMLAGQPGTELTVAVVRPRKTVPDKLTMTRTMVVEPPVSEQMYENASILYVKPVILDHEHVQAVEAKLKAMQKAGNKKILLDLRDVAAGDMSEATRLANFLLKSGTIASLEGQKVEKVTFNADPSKAINATAPLVVLVNRGTAGPGELVAAALLDNKRADLVGEKTFGEGAQQKTFELQDGAALILSVAKYETPDGKKIEDEGVTPGTLVASAIDDQGAGDDGDDDAADATTTPQKKNTITIDDQLNQALDLLKAKTA